MVRPWEKKADGSWEQLPEERRHTWQKISTPTERFREVLLRRCHTGGGRVVMGISVKISEFPPSILARAQHYHASFTGCKLLLEQEVAQILWPKMAKELSSVGGTLEAWTRSRTGGALLRSWAVGRDPEDLRGGGRSWAGRRAADDMDMRQRRKWPARHALLDL